MRIMMLLALPLDVVQVAPTHHIHRMNERTTSASGSTATPEGDDVPIG
jgi:hypothetical protein